MVSLNNPLSIDYFGEITLRILIVSFTSQLQLTASKCNHLGPRYGSVKMLGSRYSLFIDYLSLEVLDGADGTRGSF